MDRVRAAHHQRVGFRACARDQRMQQRVDVVEQPLARGAELERERGVEDVAAGEAEMQVSTVGADRLGDLADERDHVVVRRPLDLGDPLHVDGRPLLDRGEGVRPGISAAPGLGAGDGDLDAEHVLEAGRLGPDRAHLGQRVAAGSRGGPDVVPPLQPRPRDVARRPVRRARRRLHVRAPADDGDDPAAVRPPRTVGIAARSGMEHEGAGLERIVDPLDRVPAPGPLRVALRGEHDPDRRRRQRGRRCPASRSRPRAAASSNGPSATARRGRITWVSGSPKRALNSSSRGPSAVSIRPGVERAAERRAASGELAKDRSVEPLDDVLDGLVREIRPAASRRPCRRCSGRGHRRAGACGRAPAATPRPARHRRAR